MSSAALIEKARAAGLALSVSNGKLRGKGLEPTPQLLAELRAHRAELVAFLATTPASAAGDQLPPEADRATASSQCGGKDATVEFGDHICRPVHVPPVRG
jgi:hypothetical protein